MAAPRWQPDPDEFRKAWEEASSLNELCVLLNISLGTLYRYARSTGLNLAPKKNAGVRVKSKPVEVETDAVQETAHDREVRRLKDSIKLLTSKYEAAVKASVGNEDLINVIRDECCVPRELVRLAPRPKRVGRLPKREVVMQLSDWQLGELVIPDESGGNTYDHEVFQVRLDRWQDAVIGSVRNQQRAYAIESASIVMCGDMVEGHDIYSGQPWALSMDAGRQVVEGGDWFAAAIESVVTSLPDVEFSVYCVSGNHGKPGGRKAGHMPPTLNFDWMLYKWIERACSNLPLSEFAIEPGGRLLFYQAGHVFLTTHGDEVRGWGGFPHYGLDKAHGRLVVDLETVFKYWLLGHWHQAAVLPAGRGARIVNGNAVGPNQLSQAAVLGSATPCQNLLFVSEDFGLAEIAHIHLAPNEFVKPHIHGRAPALVTA